MLDALIVGGGITGLSAAYDLAKADASAVVVERSATLGGVIRTERIEGNLLECGPDSFISQKPAALELIRELGLSADVIGSNDSKRITYIKRNGSLIPMPDGLMMMVPTKLIPMAMSPLLGWGTKLRMGLEYFRGARDSKRPDRSVSDFITDHYGQETLEYLAEPLLSGVYGGDPGLLSVNSVLPRFVDLETQYGSLTRGVIAQRAKAPPAPAGSSLFRTLKSGLGSLVQALEPKQALLNKSAESIERTSGGYRLKISGDWLDAKNIILTGPSYNAAALLASIHPELAKQLNQTQYSSSATVNVGYRTSRLEAPLKGFGLLVPKKERKRLLACTFVGNKFSHRVTDGWQVVRCFFGGAGDAAVLEESDDAIRSQVILELKDLLNISVDPDFCSISRWPRSMAQYTVGHAARQEMLQAAIKTLPGIHLAGNGYIGIGLPDCIQMGRAAANAILTNSK